MSRKVPARTTRVVGVVVRQSWGICVEDVCLCWTCLQVKTYAEQIVLRYLTCEEGALVCARCLQELDPWRLPSCTQ